MQCRAPMVACLRMRPEVMPTATEAAMQVKEVLRPARAGAEALASIPGQIGTSSKESDWTLCSGGPGDASGGSGRAQGRLLRPADGRDGRKGRHANLRGREGVNATVAVFYLYCPSTQY